MSHVLRGTLSLTVTSLFACGAIAQPIPFQEHPIDDEANGAHSISITDIDGDTDPDIVAATRFGNELLLYTKTSLDPAPVVFADRTLSANLMGARKCLAVDINNTGRPDVITTSSDDNKVAWFPNQGGPMPDFVEIPVSLIIPEAWGLDSGDLDGDDDVDVLATAVGNSHITWFENMGGFAPEWELRTITTTALGAIAVCVDDIDDDGDLDFASASFDDDTISWYENDGATDPTFTKVPISVGVYLSPTEVHTADIDDDDDIDIIASAFESDTLVWFENDGAMEPSFTPRVITTLPSGPTGISTFDLNQDGHLDILNAAYGQSGANGEIAWYENDGMIPPTFTRRVIANSGVNGAQEIHAEFIDGDKYPDVVTASVLEDKVSWWENKLEPDPCDADLNLDEAVTASDIAVLLGSWGVPMSELSMRADIDGSGLVDAFDLATLLSFWGPCP